MKNIFYSLVLLSIVPAIVLSKPQRRADRLKVQREARLVARKDLDAKFKKQRTIDAIASAQQESRMLTRDALVSSWATREKEMNAQNSALGQFAHMYISPEWTPAMRQFIGSQSLSVEYAFSHVSQGFDEAGNVVDSSVVRFGKKQLLSDILLASKVAASSGVTPAAGLEFLQDLSSTAIPFQASIDTHSCNLMYRVGFARNRVQMGVRVPLREQIRRIVCAPELTAAEQGLLRDRSVVDEFIGTARNAIFRDQYGLSVPAMVTDLIAQKNMIYLERLAKASIGDMSFFTTINFFPWRLDRWTVSAELIVPGKKEADSQYFYPVIPDSSGFLSVKLSTGFVGRKTVFGSPHLMVSCQNYFPASLKMRVPRMVSATDASSLPTTEIFGQDIAIDPVQSILKPECSSVDFAAQTAVAGLRPGFGLDFTVGTVLNPFISPYVELDLYYHFHMRGSDEIRAGLSLTDWHTNALASVPYRAQHRVGFSVIYQPTTQVLIRAGFNGVVAGRSAPLEVAANTSLSWVW